MIIVDDVDTSAKHAITVVIKSVAYLCHIRQPVSSSSHYFISRAWCRCRCRCSIQTRQSGRFSNHHHREEAHYWKYRSRRGGSRLSEVNHSVRPMVILTERSVSPTGSPAAWW